MKYLLAAALFFLIGIVGAQSPYNALGDTLTVIMAPLLNVPAIHIPGETLTITCVAPQNTTGWQVSLVHGSKNFSLNITSSQYLSAPARWELQATVPSVPVFELYDLRVTASGGIDDTTANAVKLLPSRKSSYYFFHVTDLHLPTRVYYPDAGFDSDSTSVNDFRSVIEDINLANPEFVLLTGDLLNEGELEGFAGQYWYGWTQRLLEEIEVPVFVTAGNHDVGGWNATPPPAGSSRRNWWRYFGWPWLDNPDSNWGMHTQEYDFTYGDVHYIGLEAYDNYDNWRANIYGGQSFIYHQMLWLQDRLAFQPDKTKVLFYHYDFSDQINLSSLGADMGLWGHIHYNSGSTGSYPYSLATRSVCDGNRAYRPIRVNGSQLQPMSTIYAGAGGNNLFVNYYPANSATADSVLAIVTNNQGVGFENSLLKFRMPPGNAAYHVTNGTLLQVDRGPLENVCHVQVNLSANSVKYVSIAVSGTPADDPMLPEAALIRGAHPNPFAGEITIQLDSRAARTSLKVYNLRGELVRSLTAAPLASSLTWDGFTASGQPAPAGIYLLQAEDGTRREARRVVKISSR